MSKLSYPAWFNSPDGKSSAIFEAPEDVPTGWTSGAEKISAKAGGKPADPAKTDEKPPVKDDKAELDAHGHIYDPALHAATKSKTKEGLWRMKVGVKRPDPAPGYPLDL